VWKKPADHKVAETTCSYTAHPLPLSWGVLHTFISLNEVSRRVAVTSEILFKVM
jgi:hypothetical protein